MTEHQQQQQKDERYNRNCEQFAFSNKLDQERYAKLNELPECNHDDRCFVFEWFHNSITLIGVGVSYNDPNSTVRLTLNVRPGLFVLSGDVPTLRTVSGLYNYGKVRVYPFAKYSSNNFILTDAMLNPESIFNASNVLCKIETPSFLESVILHRKFVKDNDIKYKFAAVTHYWDATKQVMFELICKRMLASPEDYEVPKIIHRWFDHRLQPYKLPKPEIPMITFDIETVSTDPHRVPTGEDINDVLYTTAIHHADLKTIYTFVYLPIENRSNQDLQNEMLELDKYYKYPGETNIVEVFNTELDLLKRTMEMLRFPFNNKSKDTPYKFQVRRRLHYLIGYNSLKYDIKYLLMRCQFYGICEGEFVYNNGYSFGLDQIHIDLFCIARLRYKLSKYTLNNLCATILKDKKVDVDAVALRFSFLHMKTTQKLYKHGDKYMVDNKMPSVRDTLHYNNRDTMLVTELVRKTDTLTYVMDYAHVSRIPMTSINVNYDKIKYRLLNRCEVTAMEKRMFLTILKSSRQVLVLPIKYGNCDSVPVTDAIVADDYMYTERDNESLLGGRVLPGGKKRNYPGGINYCNGEYDVPDIQEYDYRIAYPMLMDRLNMSDETCAIMTARDLSLLFPFVKNKHQYRVFDYVTHIGNTKTSTRILIHSYIYNGKCPGKEFKFTYDELTQRGMSPVIVIWSAPMVYRGIISEIIRSISQYRELVKSKRNALNDSLEIIDMEIQADVEITLEMDGKEENNDNEKPTENKDGDDYTESNNLNHNIVPVESKSGYDSENYGMGPIGSEDDSDLENYGMEPIGSEDDSDPENYGIEPIGLEDDIDPENCDLKPIDSEDDKDSDNGVMTCRKSDGENTGSDQKYDPIDLDSTTNKKKYEMETTNKQQLCVTNEPKLPLEKCVLYGFNSKYIIECLDGTVVTNIPKELNVTERLEILYDIKKLVQLEHEAMDSLYLALKPIAASVYGVIGRIKPEMAASITCIIRTTLLREARLAVTLGRTVYYCDTDCIHMNRGDGRDLSSKFNELFPYTELEKKEKGRCMYVTTKVYYTWPDTNIKYGANVNGPPSWRYMVEFFEKRLNVTNTVDVLNAFRDFYKSIYDRILNDGVEDFSGFQWLTQDIKITTRESTLELKRYLSQYYKSMSGAFRQNVFYYQQKIDVTKTVYRPSIEICSSENETFDNKSQSIKERKIARLRNMNLFKYFFISFKTVYNLLNFHIKKNNAPYNVTLNETHTRYLMLCGYYEAYNEVFSNDESNVSIIEYVALTEDTERCVNDGSSELYPKKPRITPIIDNDESDIVEKCMIRMDKL